MPLALIAGVPNKSLALCIAALLAADASAATGPEDVSAPQVVVMNCNDSGAGSLREALFSVAAHSLIDLSQLQCSAITLISGAIAVTADDITVKGPGTGPS